MSPDEFDRIARTHLRTTETRAAISRRDSLGHLIVGAVLMLAWVCVMVLMFRVAAW